MTYKLLKAYLPSDIVDYVLIDCMVGSKNHWKNKFNDVMKELEEAVNISYVECCDTEDDEENEFCDRCRKHNVVRGTGYVTFSDDGYLLSTRYYCRLCMQRGCLCENECDWRDPDP